MAKANPSKLFTVKATALQHGHWIPSVGPYGVKVMSITIAKTVEVHTQCMKRGTARPLSFDIDELVEVRADESDEIAKWEGIVQAGADAQARQTVVRSSAAAQWVSDMRTICGCKACIITLGSERTCVVRDLIRANPMSGQLVGSFMTTPMAALSGLDGNGQSVTSPLPPPLQLPPPPGDPLPTKHAEKSRRNDWQQVCDGKMTHDAWNEKWARPRIGRAKIPS